MKIKQVWRETKSELVKTIGRSWTFGESEMMIKLSVIEEETPDKYH